MFFVPTFITCSPLIVHFSQNELEVRE